MTRSVLLGLGLVAVAISTAQAHRAGRVHRPATAAMEPCPLKPDFPIASAYLQRLAAELAAPQPQAFVGVYAIENFCFNIELSAHYGAHADLDRGEVVMRSAVLLGAQDDAQVASILGHELSHILLQHPGAFGGGLRDTMAFVLTDDSEYMDLYSRHRALDAEKMELETRWRILRGRRYEINERLKQSDVPAAERAALEAELARVQTDLEPLDRKLPPLKEEVSQLADAKNRRHRQIFPQSLEIGWQEQEADEIGFELMQRAGFRPAAFYEVALLLLAPERREPCDQCLDQVASGQCQAPPRIRGSIDTHPDPCWRAHNVRHLEADAHDYGAIPPRAERAGLAQAQAEIRARLEGARR